MIMAKKGYNYPVKKKIPLILLLNLFGIFIISQFLRFVNIFSRISSRICSITFQKVKSLALRERWRRSRRRGGNPPSHPLSRELSRRESLWFVQACLIASRWNLACQAYEALHLCSQTQKYGIPLSRYAISL